MIVVLHLNIRCVLCFNITNGVCFISKQNQCVLYLELEHTFASFRNKTCRTGRFSERESEEVRQAGEVPDVRRAEVLGEAEPAQSPSAVKTCFLADHVLKFY